HRLVHPEGHRAFEHVAPHSELGVLLTQPGQLGPLVLAQPAIAALALPPVPGHPVLQRARDDPQLPGHLRDRLARLADQAHRALLEVRIELPARLCHRPSSLKAMCPRYEGKPSRRSKWSKLTCSRSTLSRSAR